MANIRPETKVGGSLQLDMGPEPKMRGISNRKLPSTEVEDRMFAMYTASVWFIQYIL